MEREMRWEGRERYGGRESESEIGREGYSERGRREGKRKRDGRQGEEER